jgi:hypothetical protein
MTTGHEMTPTLWRTCRVLANPKRLALIGALIGALVPAVKACRSNYEPLIAALTAYTHPRRIDIVSTLHRTGPRTPEELGVRCGISLAALYRHLDKLDRRNVLQQTESSVSLRHPPHPFARMLLALACDTPDADGITH